MAFETGTYRKGNSVRNVSTRKDAVQAVFDGFVLAAPAADATYTELQDLAKTRGIAANQSADALRDALTTEPGTAEYVVDNPSAPETGSTSLVTGPEGSTGTDASTSVAGADASVSTT